MSARRYPSTVVPFRFPDELLAWITAEAARTGQTVQAFIINTMWVERSRAERTRTLSPYPPQGGEQ